ncbi:MAG: response regulator [Proteobacteria bacterium]|nr:response regulator [Pseudomonadota bacterium]
MKNRKRFYKKILIVDDNLAMRKMLEGMLTSLGYKDIYSAIDGESGWEKILEGDIEIVISDYVMPRLNGLEFLHRIRSSKEFFDLPFIMITGADNWGDFINTVQAEVDSYLIKPITPVRLEEVLNQIHCQQKSTSPYLKAIHAGKHCYINQEMAKAFKHFLLAQAIEPTLAKPYYYLGEISKNHGKTADAEKFFKKCLEIEGNYINAIIGLADIYSLHNDYPQMITSLSNALKVAPTNLDLHLGLARASFMLGDLMNARKSLSQAAKIAKSNRDSVMKVVDAYVAYGMFDEADYLFGKKLEDDDNETVKFWNRLGLKAKENGDFQKSKYFYLSALKLRPQSKEVNFNIAILLYEQGEYDNSMAYASKALRLHPDFLEAQQLINALRLKLDQLSP